MSTVPSDLDFIRLLPRLAKQYAGRTALMYKSAPGASWTDIAWPELAHSAGQVSRALIGAGLEKGEVVAVFAPNCPEYYYINFGAYQAGVVTTPFFPSSSQAEVEFMLRDAGVRIIFVGNQQQYDVAFPLFATVPSLHKFVIINPEVKRHPTDSFSLYFDEFMRLGAPEPIGRLLSQRKALASPNDIADILYTSGTTGRSKGVILTYSMYSAALKHNWNCLDVREGDVVLEILPLSHIFERGWGYLCLAKGCTLAVNSDPHQASQALREIHPNAMSAVPRLWEKIYANVMHQVNIRGNRQRALFHLALNVGRRYWVDHILQGRQPSSGLSLQYRIADRAVLSKVRSSIGLGTPRLFPVAGAALSPSVEIFVHSCGIPMVAAYGLTETTATVSIDQRGQRVTMGSVGRVIPGLEVRIAPDGEILVRGGSVTKGYYHRPLETAQAIDSEGWFHTGDAGYLKGGELFLTDRIKNLYKTSNGKYIAPQLIESALVVDRYIDQVMVIADRFKFVSALIVPDYALLKRYADRHGIPCADRQELCSSPRIHAFLEARIARLQTGLADYEKVKRFALLTRPFSIERDELTNTMKMTRDKIFDHHIRTIESLYKS